jgi:hypothetical protein
LTKTHCIPSWTMRVFSSTVTWFGSDLRVGHFFTFRCPLVSTPQLNTQLLNSLTTRWLNWRTELFYELTMESESTLYVTTDCQSASLSWNNAPTWGQRPDLYYCQIVAFLLMWGALSDESTGLSFTIAAGPRQRSLPRVRVPWDSWKYYCCLRFEISLFVTVIQATHQLHVSFYNSGRTE